ncbi:uncharacterized protein NECHADRAFT_79559 [Fusarium vanettenii 77-13-4]|uniref:BZIP domain-containing protein n=1 Tax=Fusarium vanettenii (strain ATCC MYA-4622 / CBS 123669 / FGSC 9596 / NRRL 45880 / 77-13-4) TaxID=660122 RepID=C7Z7U4_FUSV7|nr:uncharacterized protein NECHADRAFT_79559 [Fusarium vanettenii 77-13-4]EEU39886.1 hypothetical protein NECHADRAFT_79559 [Fusarium vanettenii 77-13-4]
MPRKNRTPESLALNRENQRRSRARQRELLEDLQRRVREYETRDGQATLEMQRVARAVAGENAALRSLLASKGVAADEVEAHLEAARAGASSTVSMACTPASNSPCAASPVTIAPRPVACSQPSGCAPCSSQRQLKARSSATPTPAAPSPQPCKQEADTPTISCRPQPRPESQETSNPKPLDKIHCMEAATILAQIRGNSDMSQARAALGCSNNDNCLVRNTDLLDLMDEMT